MDMDLPQNLLLGHQQTPPKPPPAEEEEEGEEEEEDDSVPRQLLPLSLPNGAHKKLHQATAPRHLSSHRPSHERRRANHMVYRQCMKNHAASLGGHALDGCGEFMPSPGSSQTEPTSLTCAACGCHRNFHRRLLLQTLGAEEAGGGAEAEEDGDGEDYGFLPNLRPAVGFNRYGSSAPHMLMALSTGVHGGAAPSGSSSPQVGAVGTAAYAGSPFGSALPAKRFRTKFTPEQKASMQDLCERLGWRMQKRDEALVEQRCQEMGVSRGVFKVWMHNNKHAFVGGPSSRRGGGGGVLIGSFQLGAGGHPHPPAGGDAATVAAGDGGRANGDGGNNIGESTAAHAVVNSSSVSS